MRIVPHWVWKAFCFPCQVRTRALVSALSDSRDALETRRAAARSLKEYVDERAFASQRALN